MASYKQSVLLFALLLSYTSAYTYLVFEMEWPGTICQQKSCSAQYLGNFDDQNFNIHGLWPSGSRSNPCSYPSNCSNDDLDYSQINQSDIDYINAYWVGLYNDSDSFRTHEWQKHGTCFNGSETQFFSTVTSLHKQYNPIKALANHNIVPSDNQTYTLTQIQSAIENDFQGPALLKCVYVQGTQMLSVIDLFISSDLKSLLKCPCNKNLNSLCNNRDPIVIPTF
ncbi:ribonuclease T2 family protein (macronuclear) [Tetrahymena thermophila SB210]|uniref:Ribonuclease T2 family protein n=1 Tax=Tetrahymena thermophila (strain SB210) TaxID=312017 RepID=Q231N4_TETTS|nr:ribonuclease T2 family protein [Tetrahymena thermophila SB210]EAR91268.1 ribonuclease T2 family protein [Tetrahymena thermophila SB210]|eukprot:XP_001011513.1 ribonuclease T2 family protein [Tetrahymena thermophila SB210]